MSLDDYCLNVHEGLETPSFVEQEITRLVTVNGNYNYYHYNCDQVNDAGWGCGYRTLQTMCSWIKFKLIEKNRKNNTENKIANVPSILEIQKILSDSGDKPSNFVGSKNWIGCFEASIVIDSLYDIPCKILHCPPYELNKNFSTLWSHFESINSIAMMGGDLDGESKGILGLTTTKTDCYYLIADPHCRLNKPNKEILHKDKWISWENESLYNNGSFYNFCLPQFKN